MTPDVLCRPATVSDMRKIAQLMQPLVDQNILLGKEMVVLYESVQQFIVAEIDGEIVGYGALHVMWEHMGEVRTLGVIDRVRGKGVGHRLLTELEQHALRLGLSQLVSLTFEVEFFARHGWRIHYPLTTAIYPAPQPPQHRRQQPPGQGTRPERSAGSCRRAGRRAGYRLGC